MTPVPVFVIPESLDFYLNARHTHKQLMSLFNPYDFAVNFKVLCTSPNLFTVVDHEGLIVPHSSLDLVVRYIQPSVPHNSTTEKFRVTMFDRDTQQVLGNKEITINLKEGEPLSHQESFSERFQPLPKSAKQTEEKPQTRYNHQGPYREQQVNKVAIAVCAVCIIILMLPTQPDTTVQSQLPDWLHIGSGLKIVFAFVLGLVSMLVLRP